MSATTAQSDAPGEVIHFNPWRDFNDAPLQEDPFGIEPDREQIATFLDVVFGYCEGLIPVRGFVDKGQGFDGKPHNIWIDADAIAPRQAGDLRHLGVARGRRRLCHPRHRRRAAARPAPADVLQMQAIVVDLDAGDIGAKLAHLVQHLGAPDPGGGKRRAHARGCHQAACLVEAHRAGRRARTSRRSAACAATSP